MRGSKIYRAPTRSHQVRSVLAHRHRLRLGSSIRFCRRRSWVSLRRISLRRIPLRGIPGRRRISRHRGHNGTGSPGRRIPRTRRRIRSNNRARARSSKSNSGRILTTEQILQPHAQLLSTGHILPFRDENSLLLGCLRRILLDRDEEQARQDRTQESETIGETTSGFLADHSPAEYEPTLDQPNDEEQTKPAEENG